MAGVVVFGREPRVEVPPAPSELNLMGIESMIDAENTDLGAAVKLALATFPEDTARRIVVISDGNENRGNLLEQALAAKPLGVQVNVLPIEYFYDREVLVEKVSIPPDVKKGEKVNIDVVIRASEPTRGTLQIFQKSDNATAPAAGNEQPQPDRARARGQRLARSSSSSPSRTSTPSAPSSIPRREAATAGRSTTRPRGSPTRGARPRSC